MRDILGNLTGLESLPESIPQKLTLSVKNQLKDLTFHF